MPEGPDGAAAPPAPPPSDDAPAGDLGITVALDQFSGPMDLLLYLVRKSEVDVKDLPITAIADQFATWVSTAAASGVLDLDSAGDFVVMAASLLEIKARMVAPPPEGTQVADDGEDAFDPRQGLIRKLLVYRAAKEAAFDLDRRDDERRLRHERGHREVVPDDEAEVDAWELKDVDVGALATLWFDLLKRLDAGGPRTVIVDDVPMGVRMARLVEDMRARGEGRMSELFALEPGAIGRVGIVMALLECTRQRLLQVRQGEQYGDVHIRFRPEEERPIASGDPGPPEQLPKRQRRPPLVTWSGRPGAPEAAEESDGEPGDEPPVENEEQRFLRELESTIGVERLLGRAADLELGFIAWWEETHPGDPLPPGVVKPAPPPPPPPPPEPKAEAVAAGDAPAKPKRMPPRPRQPANETPAAAPPAAEAAVTPTALPEPVAGAQPAALPVPASGVQPVPLSSPPAPAFEVVPLAAADQPAPVIAPSAEVAAPAVVQAEQPAEATQPAATTEAAAPPTAAAAEPAPAPEPQPVAETVAAVEVPPAVLPDPAPIAMAETAPQLPDSVVEPAAPATPLPDPVAASASPEQERTGEADPAPEAQPEPAVAAESPSAPASASEPAPEPAAPIVAEPEPAALAPSTPEPAPEPIAVAATEPEPVALVPSTPEPAPEPIAVAATEPEPVALVPSTPEPAPEPIPAAAAAAPAPEPEVAVAASPEPAPEPVLAATSSPPPAAPPPPDPPDGGGPTPPPSASPIPPTRTSAPTPSPTKPPMSRPSTRMIAAVAALWVVATLGVVAWTWRPAGVLAVSAPASPVVARDGEAVFTLNLPLDAERLAEAPPIAVEPASAGSVAWRDARTAVFTAAGLGAGEQVRIVFPERLRAQGGFRFAEAPPSFTLQALPAVAVQGEPLAELPAFGPGTIRIALSRAPADPAALLAGLRIEPALPVQSSLDGAAVLLRGEFLPGTTYRLVLEPAVTGRLDDRPIAWTGELAMPARTPGARLAGTPPGRGAAIEAVNCAWVVVEAADGRRAVLHPGADGRAALPAWLLADGENGLVLRWDGGEAVATVRRTALPLTPADGADALAGRPLHLVSQR